MLLGSAAPLASSSSKGPTPSCFGAPRGALPSVLNVPLSIYKLLDLGTAFVFHPAVLSRPNIVPHMQQVLNKHALDLTLKQSFKAGALYHWGN